MIRGERGTTLVELLVASTLGLVVVLAAVQLLKTHAAIALRVQADLGASGGAAWALRTALRDVKRAGGDPLQRGLAAFGDANAEAMTTHWDADASGAIDSGSEEVVGLHWAEGQGGRLLRRVGAQSMSILAGVPAGGFRLRYFDRKGNEIASGDALDEADRRRVRRVEVAVDATERLGTVEGRASLVGAASVRVREGRP